MSLYVKILSEFSRISLYDKSKLDIYDTNSALDRLTSLNTHENQFDRQIAQQLWEQTRRTPQGKVLLKDYIQTIIDAQCILNQNIQNCQEELKYQINTQKRYELQQSLVSYTQDYNILIRTFRIEPNIVSNIEDIKQKVNTRKSIDSPINSKIFSEALSSQKESHSLKILFYLVMLGVILRHHFLNLLAFSVILLIYGLRYFHGKFIKICILLTVLSLLMDTPWIFIRASDYWSPYQATHIGHQYGFFKFIVILTIIIAFLKIIIVIILFKFKDNNENISKMVKIFNITIELQGKQIRNVPIFGVQ